MEQVIQNAPLQQFARKAYFWRQVNTLRNQTGLPSHVGYHHYSADALESEFVRLSKRKIQQALAVEAAKSLHKKKFSTVVRHVPIRVREKENDIIRPNQPNEEIEALYGRWNPDRILTFRNPQRMGTIEFMVDNTVPDFHDYLRDKIYPLLRRNTKYLVRYYSEKKFIVTDKLITIELDSKIKKYYQLSEEIKSILAGAYEAGLAIIQLIPEVLSNPELNRLYDGFYNCAIGPVIYHLAQLTQNKDVKGKINKLKKMNATLTNGASSNDLQTIANISKFKISVVDRMKKVWKSFEPLKKSRVTSTILMEVRGNHLVSKYEKQLSEVKSENDIFSVKFEEVEFDQFKDKEIVWHEDLSEILAQNPSADIISSKGDTRAVILSDVIHKKIFNEYLTYPDQFGDGGVGKQKFLEQNPGFKTYVPNKYDEALLQSDIRSIYFRTKKSNPNNFKYDHNHSYKSFKQSGIYRGIPIIEGCVRINKNVSEATELLDMHGLFFTDSWYPIEIIKYNYETYGKDPVIREMMFGEEIFDIDETAFTNPQFRSFIGKCYSQFAENTWRTNNYSEFLRARYILQDKVIGLDEKDGVYSIVYKKENKQWCMPIIYTYVLRHQRLIMENHLAQLDQVPVYVCVDGIELEAKTDIFDIGRNPGQWKLEEINMRMDQSVFKLKADKGTLIEAPYYSDVKKMIKRISENQYIHVCGAGGNGKSHLLKLLAKVYLTAGVCATTHQAVRQIGGDAKTYYKMFNIGNDIPFYKRPIYFIDECSMLSAEHLIEIMEKAPSAKIIIFGDFYQLPVVSGTPINTHDVYDVFKTVELKKNWRQSADPEFYSLCCSLRGFIELDDAVSIIKTLNKRVVKLPKFDTKDDIYIAGINSQVNAINASFPLSNGCKVIATKTVDNYVNGLRGIYTDGYVKWNDGTTSSNPIHISVDYASTVHKAQGCTYTGNVIINPTGLFEINHLYVALTRATKLENIYLTHKLTLEMFRMTCNVERN